MTERTPNGHANPYAYRMVNADGSVSTVAAIVTEIQQDQRPATTHRPMGSRRRSLLVCRRRQRGIANNPDRC